MKEKEKKKKKKKKEEEEEEEEWGASRGRGGDGKGLDVSQQLDAAVTDPSQLQRSMVRQVSGGWSSSLCYLYLPSALLVV